VSEASSPCPDAAPGGGLRRRSLLVGCTAGAAGLFTSGRAPAAPVTPAVRVVWPRIELLDGTVVTPESWRGVAAIVVFWSTTCPFCRRHNVHVEKLFRRTVGRPLRVLGVALDRDAATVRRYMADHRYGFAVTLDDGRLQRQMSDRRVIPTTCVVGADGHLLQTLHGEMFEEDVLELPLRVGQAQAQGDRAGPRLAVR
jgi:hypothetical protein